MDEGIPVFIGDITSAGALACAAVAKEEQIVLVSQAATTPELSGYSPYVFRTISSDLYQGRGMARIFRIFHPPDTDKITVLYINNTYGTGLMDSFVNAQDESGFTVQQVIPFEEGGQRTFTSEIAAIRTSGTDGVALISHVTEADYILKEAEHRGLMSPGSGQTVSLPLNSIPMSARIRKGSSPQCRQARFATRYSSVNIRYGPKTARSTGWPPYSYDTMMVVTEAIRHGGVTRRMRSVMHSERSGIWVPVAQKSLRMTVESPPPMT
ncbi:ABC transporter substrate-binding protein [Methanogenium cariaci]|uniref:ABC transporter substrate-binding protein n=1 Tax=Methanogenium cariaci TaxID=2197 RepID=UPI00155D9504|nr:ABC transporter substrate-binding protein [Methanogenium cariaci]